MNNGESRASKFMNKVETFASVEVTLPSQRVVLLRRPPLKAWAIAGTLPPFFSGEVREAWAKSTDFMVGEQEPSLERGSFMLKVVRSLARWAFLDPKLEDGADGTGDSVDPSLLTEDDWGFLALWLLQGSPEIPVETSSGEVQMDDLHRFREGAQG